MIDLKFRDIREVKQMCVCVFGGGGPSKKPSHFIYHLPGFSGGNNAGTCQLSVFGLVLLAVI